MEPVCSVDSAHTCSWAANEVMNGDERIKGRHGLRNKVRDKWESCAVGQVLTLECCALTALTLAEEEYFYLLFHPQLFAFLSEHVVDAIADALGFKFFEQPAVAICGRLVFGRLEGGPEGIGCGSAAVWNERDAHRRCWARRERGRRVARETLWVRQGKKQANPSP